MKRTLRTTSSSLCRSQCLSASRSRVTLPSSPNLIITPSKRSYLISDPPAPINPSVCKPPRHGQPLPFTHSHLLQPGELVPGLQSTEFETRRRRLMERMEQGAVVISLGAKVVYSSQNIFYKFRQATDFMYLTGFNEPDSALVLVRDSSSRGYKMTMFVPSRTASSDLWDGGKTGQEGAVEFFKADEAFPLSHLSTHLSTLIPDAPAIHIDLASPSPKSKKTFLSSLFPASPSSEMEALVGKIPTTKLSPLAPLVQTMRGIKSEAEWKIMKRAGDITGKGHAEVMGFASSSRSEADLVAHFEYICALEGSERPAYVPVVASGANSLVIHYTENNCKLNDGELVLIDAGCELNSYVSDCTRTFPVSGAFTEPQKDLYQAVLEVNKLCIQMCTMEGGRSSNSLHSRSVSLMKQELNNIGFNLNEAEVSALYPHGLSHYVGMDLHDTPLTSKDSALVQGQILTIEPGVYVPYDSRFPKHFHGMGIRIEDEVLVLPEGPMVLTSHAPKEILDVEGACQRTLLR
ncbi:peptidase M24 [Mrakia frigida]|uniref:aminopeptidase P family protein n=1 Tax=Mrakia frigida TaxID=29902 RepID=UPI003FCC1753